VTRATRVRKARKWSPCALCPVLICTGNLIGLLPDGRWAHIACIIATQHPEPVK
jgi:hypothetical protein